MSTFIVLSSDASGSPVTNAATGDAFTVKFEPPIRVPEDSEILPIRGVSWNTSPNISTAKANNIFAFTDGIANYSVTLDDALYSLSDLQDKIANITLGFGFGTPTKPLFEFRPLIALGKVEIVVNAIGITIQFSAVGAPYELLGFAAADLGPTVANPEVFTSTTQANFSQGVNSHVLNCSLAADSYINGVSGSAVLELSLSNTSPNRQVVSENVSGYRVPLSTRFISTATVWITDQAGRYITLNGYAYSLTLSIAPK